MKSIIIAALVCFLISSAAPLAYTADEYVYRKAKVLEVKGDALFKKAGSEKWLELKKDMILSQRDEVKTGKNGFIKMIFDEKGSFEEKDHDVIKIFNESEIMLTKAVYDRQKNEKTTLLKLEMGKIISKAAKIKGGSKFEIETPTCIVGVRGTEYEVEYRPSE